MRVLWGTIIKSDDNPKISLKIIEFCNLGRVMDCGVGSGEVCVLCALLCKTCAVIDSAVPTSHLLQKLTEL
jgi:hypothetical protein